MTKDNNYYVKEKWDRELQHEIMEEDLCSGSYSQGENFNETKFTDSSNYYY